MLTPLLEPSAEQDRNGLRDAPLSGNPIPHGPGRDPEPGGGSHLGQAELPEDGAQLLGGHGHGAIKIGTTCPSLASRHVVPTLPGWPVVRSQPRSGASGERSGCLRNSRTSCASWAPARCRVTSSFGRSSPHGAGCGSPWRRSGRAPTVSAGGPGSLASHGNVHRSVRSCSRLPPLSRAPSSFCYCRFGGACGRSCVWLTRCGRSGSSSLGARLGSREGP
jgi:hypothetical protein